MLTCGGAQSDDVGGARFGGVAGRVRLGGWASPGADFHRKVLKPSAAMELGWRSSIQWLATARSPFSSSIFTSNLKHLLLADLLGMLQGKDTVRIV
ncbi:unnamed protein product [Urochloa humidicola]